MNQKVILIGFGTVGQGLCEILSDKRQELIETYDYKATVVGVSDPRFGTIYDQNGFDLMELVRDAASGSFSRGVKDWDSLDLIRNADADVVCELAFTDLQTGEPAISHCKAAFESGKSVVTSNKGPAALAYRELADQADANGVEFLIEGTVMAGTPVLNLAWEPLSGCTITSARGILNGTTNYILTQMEEGMRYADALVKAQELGYAEADPSGDVEGYDARAKVTILANVVMDVDIPISEVACEGISRITSEDIAKAKSAGARWKLIGSVSMTVQGIEASVRPEMVPLGHPLAGVMGASNALTYGTDLLGDVTIVGPGAGRVETGFSILTDLLSL